MDMNDVRLKLLNKFLQSEGTGNIVNTAKAL